MDTETIHLANGLTITLRPFHARDVVSILEMHQRSSMTSLFYRYLRSYHPTFEELQRLYQLDEENGTTFVAVVEFPWETVIGVATYYIIDRTPQSVTAEPAFLIEDRFQGQGLGRALFNRLIRHALAQGIDAFNFYIEPGNKRMRYVIRRSSLPFEEEIVYGTRQVRLQLEPQLDLTRHI
ncbi:MAG TPA: GNAT family protein [Anaerolineae bacterium]